MKNTSKEASGPEGDEALAAESRGYAPTSDDADAVDGDLDGEGEVDATGDAAGMTVGRTQPVPTVEDIDKRDAKRWELDPASAEDANDREP